MKPVLDETHDPKCKVGLNRRTLRDTDFPIQNLPFGVFLARRGCEGPDASVGVAIGDRILDIAGLRSEENDCRRTMIAAVDAACLAINSSNPVR